MICLFKSNPVPVKAGHNNPLVDTQCNPDPYAIFHDGMYYCYSTGNNGVNVLRSKDLKSFEHMGFALYDENSRAYWAPAVIYYEGLFYMYYSSIAQDETDLHKQFLRVAVSDNPLGPFVYKKTLYHEFSIDAHVIVKDDKLYLFYAANIEEGEKIGTMVMLDRLLDPLTPANKPRLILYPTMEEEMSARNRSGYNRDWYTIEGPFYFERDGTGFLMYSANGFERPDYFVGYATCDASLPLEEAVFSKYPSEHEYSPLMGKDDYITACGHNSMIHGPNGEFLIVYHGRPRSEDETRVGDGRRLCIGEIKIDKNKLFLQEWAGGVFTANA